VLARRIYGLVQFVVLGFVPVRALVVAELGYFDALDPAGAEISRDQFFVGQLAQSGLDVHDLVGEQLALDQARPVLNKTTTVRQTPESDEKQPS
jgi:hypothetical protein